MSQFGYANPTAVPQRGADRPNVAAGVKTIPFDYVFQFALQGVPKNKVQDVVEISTEGVFVALSVGYSLIADEESAERHFQPVINQNTLLRSPSLVPFFSSGDLNRLFITGAPGAEIDVVLLDTPPPGVPIIAVSNLPAIVTSGRIGSDGTVLLDLTPGIPPVSQVLVWDRTNNLFSQPFEIGIPVTNTTPSTPVIGPDPTTKKLPVVGDKRLHIYGSENSSIDFTVLKSNGSAPIRQTGIALNTSFTFAPGASAFGSLVSLGDPLSPGDLLIVGLSPTGLPAVAFSAFAIPRVRLLNVSLGALAAGLEKSKADLTRGFRLNPAAVPLIAADLPIDQITAGPRERIFETGGVAAEEVSFLYSLDSGNTGREYQSKPIHNIAGLGIANGDRPFRPFAKPIMFEPRSFVRIQIEELSGPKGTLYIVLQGYKLLGTGRIPG